MEKITNLQNVSEKLQLFAGITAVIIFVSLFGVRNAEAAIFRSLDLGSSGSDVSELQAQLAKDSSIYPSGLVTGYFGALTQAAVQRFQTTQGIVSSGSPSTTGYGRVGPQTISKINELISYGSSQVSWDTVPVLSTPFVQSGRTDATLTWTSNEPTQGQVYYDVMPIRADEATGPNQQPYIGGALAQDNNGMQTNHTVKIQNLQPNTVYYYLTKGIDSVANVTLTLPAPFKTNQ